MARLLSLLAAICAVAFSSTANAQCTDVHLVFARGTGEAPGLGILGPGLIAGLRANLPGKSISSYGVNYAANAAQTSDGPGATDMSNHITQYAAQCPNAQFVIGGYSQGASVTVIAIGIQSILGSGGTIPTRLAPRIKAVVTFGNPLGLLNRTIRRDSALYGAKSIDDCNFGDPVCGGGVLSAAHLTYATDGSVVLAARQAAALVLRSSRSLRGENGNENDNA